MRPLHNSRRLLDRGQLFWREVGNGPAVVFLHGTWSDSSQWLPSIEHLSLNYHCFAPDLLGFGESDRPNIHYSIQLEVECLTEYLEALDLRQVYLVGHSLGGWIAASYSLKYWERVQGLVLIAPEGVKVEGLARRRWQARSALSVMKVIFETLRALHPIIKLLGWHKKIERMVQRQQMLSSSTACKLMFQRRHSEIAAELLQEHLPWHKIPVLILQGERDTKIALALSRTYAELLPTAHLKIVSHAGNDLPQSLPETTAQHIHDFIAALESGDRRIHL
jgi:pimeloyl-ACP methyl ester carboxylesterase